MVTSGVPARGTRTRLEPPPPRAYFTEQDVADRFRVSKREVQRWVAAGMFADVLRISSKIVRIPRASVLAFEVRFRIRAA